MAKARGPPVCAARDVQVKHPRASLARGEAGTATQQVVSPGLLLRLKRRAGGLEHTCEPRQPLAFPPRGIQHTAHLQLLCKRELLRLGD